MENTIKNLDKNTALTLEECKDLEREWLRKTELVTATTEGDAISDANNELQARVTILTQQQLRLTNNLKSLQQEVKEANQTSHFLTKDVAKLNVLISANHDQEGHLQHENWATERACVEELKEMERECVQLEEAVKETKTHKQGLLDEIMEMERQALLWEKKIALDKETRAALDPSSERERYRPCSGTSTAWNSGTRAHARAGDCRGDGEGHCERAVISNRYAEGSSKGKKEKEGPVQAKELTQPRPRSALALKRTPVC